MCKPAPPPWDGAGVMAEPHLAWAVWSGQEGGEGGGSKHSQWGVLQMALGSGWGGHSEDPVRVLSDLPL